MTDDLSEHFVSAGKLLDKLDWLRPRSPPTHTCDLCAEGTYQAGVCFSCQEKRRIEKDLAHELRRRLACIPLRYGKSRFGDPCLQTRVGDARAIDLARTALASHTVLVLRGPAGSGKTSLAAAVIAAEAERGKRIAWAPAVRLAMARSEAKLGEEPQEVRDAIRSDALVIDDVGNESLTPTSALVDVVFSRHDAERPVVITTGLSSVALAERYGGGTGRRLLEQSLVVELKVRRAT
jgi:hypothetical protein